jgi:hypothetical protein
MLCSFRDQSSCLSEPRPLFPAPRFPNPRPPRTYAAAAPMQVGHQNSTDITGDAGCSGRGWLLAHKGGGEDGGDCVCFYDAAGPTCAQDSAQAGRAPRCAVVYLLYGAERYFHSLHAAISWLVHAFLQEFPCAPRPPTRARARVIAPA